MEIRISASSISYNTNSKLLLGSAVVSLLPLFVLWHDNHQVKIIINIVYWTVTFLVVYPFMYRASVSGLSHFTFTNLNQPTSVTNCLFASMAK